MNIYITQDNEKYLRNYDGSMSGLVNQLIENRRQGDKIINRDFVMPFQAVEDNLERPAVPVGKLCEHFQPKGKCLQKKCKHN